MCAINQVRRQHFFPFNSTSIFHFIFFLCKCMFSIGQKLLIENNIKCVVCGVIRLIDLTVPSGCINFLSLSGTVSGAGPVETLIINHVAFDAMTPSNSRRSDFKVVAMAMRSLIYRAPETPYIPLPLFATQNFPSSDLSTQTSQRAPPLT